MSIFGDIWNKIAGTTDAKPAEGISENEKIVPVVATSDTSVAAVAASTPASGTPIAAVVDVEVILSQLAAQRGGGGNWQSSIVDLLKLVDLDPSLENRKELADELKVHAGEAGSAEQNTALHRAVMNKMEENGGKVPDSLKSA